MRRCYAALLIVAACGDARIDDATSLPTAPPPGSTTNLGSVAANISGEQFFGRPTAAATVVEGRLSFSAYDGYTRLLSIAVDAPAPGTFESSGPYKPVVSLVESAGESTRQWISSTNPGSGSVTLTFFSPDLAIGYFSFALFPDSATQAAGITNRRNVTAGTFSVNVSR